MRRPLSLLVLSCLGLLAGVASAQADLTSASYTLRGGHVSAGAVSALSSASFLGTASSGQSEAIGCSGSASDLGTSASGFVPILVGALPTLDGDGDGVAFFLDPDAVRQALTDSTTLEMDSEVASLFAEAAQDGQFVVAVVS